MNYVYAITLREALNKVSENYLNNKNDICLCNPKNSIAFLGVAFFVCLANEVKKQYPQIKIAVDCDDKTGFAINAIKSKVDIVIIKTNDIMLLRIKNIAMKTNVLVIDANKT